MKPAIVFLLFALLFAASCKKSSGTGPSGAFTLAGNWKWVSSEGGLAGIHQTPASTGHSGTYTFRADSSMTIATDTSTVNTTYHTYIETPLGGSAMTFIYFSTIPAEHFILTHSNDTLFLSDEYVDGFLHTFVKM